MSEFLWVLWYLLFLGIGWGLGWVVDHRHSIRLWLKEHLGHISITDDPDDWCEVGWAMWQNRKNNAAFSNDRGRTYWLISEGAQYSIRNPRHKSVLSGKRRAERGGSS